MSSAVVILALLGAAQAMDPATCLAERGVQIEHNAKRYVVRDEACRELFLSDPERYSQLFDALGELAAAGKPVAPRAASLVPS